MPKKKNPEDPQDPDKRTASDTTVRDLQAQSNQLYRAANELQRTNRFQSMILDSINQGVVVVDEFSQLVAWNDEFLKLYGLNPKALQKGMDLQIFCDLFAASEDSPERAPALSFNHRLGALGAGDYLDVLADGKAIEIRISDRTSGGLIATYTDATPHFETEAKLRDQRKQLSEQVTRLRTLGSSLEEARKQAVHSDQQKSRFLAMISHDIRTPMSAIISSLELLSDDKTQKDHDRLREVALASGQQMLFLLSDIIEVSRTDGWNFTIKPENTAMTELLKAVVDAWEPLAAKKDITLNLQIGKNVPNHIQTDPKRLRQVIDNLISNAIKFTQIGSVTVNAEFRKTPQGDVIRIGVKDTGRGIDKEKQYKLFQEFGRVEDTNTPAVEGTGLGLSISKRIIESMAGTIGAESDTKSGSLFWIEIPFVPAEQIDEPSTIAPQSPSDTISKQGPPHILVVDDNQVNRMVISSSLKVLGCTTEEAIDGNDAVQKIESGDFDLILMDNYMPNASGPEAAKRIRAATTPKSTVPIVGLTASDDQHEKDVMLKAGMNVVYVKPLGKAVLTSILREYVKSPRLL
ncbi:ATP-binding protein [Planktotalea sp.]|uniref:ATP-binding protein n=1 Tax=Planktotalea sp. TaxID=2029877 RepID=UPI003F6CAE4F